MVTLTALPALIWRHLWTGPRKLRAHFGSPEKSLIQEVVQNSEIQHDGEIRVVVEGGLPLNYLLQTRPIRQRAVDLFSSYRVWDTESNSGLLIYLLLSESAVEIVADRGLRGQAIPPGSKLVPSSKDSHEANHGEPVEWDHLLTRVCSEALDFFREGNYCKGIIHIVNRITPWMAATFPPRALDTNELSDTPILLD